MKMNVKVFKSLTGEPRVVQNINGMNVGIYFMEDTPYNQQFLSKGRMSAWTSDGKEFKLLVDEGFFNASGRFFDETVNSHWIELLTNAGKINKKYQLIMMLPAFLGLIIAVVLSSIWFQKHVQTVLIVAMIAVFVVQIFQSRLINKEFNKLQTEAQNKIYDYLGKDEVSEIIKAQEEYVKEYYKIEDEVHEDLIENSEENLMILSK